MEALLEGYRRFRSGRWPAERERYESLALRGQNPATLVIACSDSRVDPQTIFGAAPGQLFVIRNVAALVPPYEPDGKHHSTSAAIEYGVRVLKVRRIVVLGHALCGGVRAMVEGVPEEARDFVPAWIGIAARVLAEKPEPSEGDLLTHYETQVVRLSLANLRTFPWIAEAIREGHLDLYGFTFDVRSGVLGRLEEERFVPVE